MSMSMITQVEVGTLGFDADDVAADTIGYDGEAVRIEVYAGPRSLGLYLGHVRREADVDGAQWWEPESRWPNEVGGDGPYLTAEAAVGALVESTLLSVGNFGITR